MYVRIFWLAMTLAVLVVIAPTRAAISITSPAEGSVITDRIQLAATTDEPGVVSVEYLMDGRPLYELASPIANPTAPLYVYTFDARYTYNGRKILTAAAKSADGTVLAISAPVMITVASNGAYVMEFLGFDPLLPQSGTLTWQEYVNYPGSIAAECSIDGLLIKNGVAALADLDLTFTNWLYGSYWGRQNIINTTRFSNGAHELYCVGFLNGGNIPSSYIQNPPAASLSKTVVFDNGHSVMALRNRWQDLYVTVGQSVRLEPYLVYTDGTRDPPSVAGVAFSSDNPSVATVAADGTVTGVSEGIATIMSTKGTLVSRTRVLVDAARQFKHLSKSGQIRSSYLPGDSLFMRSLFFLTAGDYFNYPLVGGLWQQAGINAIGGGLFPIGRSVPRGSDTQDYTSWYGSVGGGYYESWFKTLTAAQQLDMGLFFTGDAVGKEPMGVLDIFNTPWRQQALRTEFAEMTASGRVIGVDMADEADYIWGSYPKPPGKVSAAGPFTKIEVFGCPQTPCAGTAIVHYRYNTFAPGVLFTINGSLKNELNGPHLIGPGNYWDGVVITPGNNTITRPNHGIQQSGMPARFGVSAPPGIPAVMPGGLSVNITYYLIRVDNDTLKVAPTLASALAGTALALTSAGASVSMTWGIPADGTPYSTNARVAWTFPTKDVLNGVYDASTDPNLEITFWSPYTWFPDQRIGADGPSQIIITNNTATVIWPMHNLTAGQFIQVKGATDALLNRPYTIAAANATGISFTTLNVSDQTATAANNPNLAISANYYPPMGNDALARLIGIINQVPNRTPISWPVLGLAPHETFQHWMDDPEISQYNSLFYLPSQGVYYYGSSLSQSIQDLAQGTLERLPFIARHQPSITIISSGGYTYTKQVPGDLFTMGGDKIEVSGNRPETITTQLMAAVSSGMAGVRVYGYADYIFTRMVTNNTPLGFSGVQMQISPEIQPKKWQGMSVGFNLIKDLEPYILQPNINAPNLGPFALAGAKEGNGGRLLIATSFSEVPQTLNIDFGPYTYNGTIKRHRVSATRRLDQAMGAVPNDTITLSPGESAVYLFLPATTIQRRVVLALEGTAQKNTTGQLQFIDATSRAVAGTALFNTDANGFATIVVPPGLAAVDARAAVAGYLARVVRNVDVTSGGILDITIPSLPAGDFNQDSAVNSLDWSTMNRNWFGPHALADINRDGVVNSLDFSFLSKNWLARGE